MGKKIDEAFYRLTTEANHHIRLSQTRNTEYDNGFAQGFVEALRIVSSAREGGQTPLRNSFPEGLLVPRPTKRKAFGRRGNRR
jgi:hypothetical protein